MSGFFDILWTWTALDTWIVVIGALAAMACAIPGCFLFLRRQSMTGDALSHTSLLGIVLAYMLAIQLERWGWLAPAHYALLQHAFMLGGAMLIGVLSAVLTEWVQQLGRVEASAALGVVFTVAFSAGLLLIRMVADQVHIDPDCVLYGAVETAYSGSGIPAAAFANGGMLVANLLLTALLFKELRVSSFDPSFATAVGIPARGLHFAQMAVTAATVVAAFESVGVILVVAMLITPAATAYLLTDRLSVMLGLSLFFAAGSALLGHVLAITLPPLIFARLGVEGVRDASTAGMMAVASGLLFVTVALGAPRYGVLSRWLGQVQLALRIASEDILGALYRNEERRQAAGPLPPGVRSGLLGWVARRRLVWRRELAAAPGGWQLTPAGRRRAEMLVRSHRLWETYVARHFHLTDELLHESAERAEHFIGRDLRSELERELSAPDLDPHGRSIPSEDAEAAGS